MLDKFWFHLSNKGQLGENVELTRKLVLLNLIIFSGCVFLIILGAVALFQGNPVLGLADFLCIVLLGALYLFMRISGKYNVAAHWGMMIILALYSYLFIDGGVNQSAYVWTYTFPLVSIILLGISWGSIYYFMLFFIMLAASILAHRVPFITQYPRDLLIRIFPSHMVVYLFCLYMEKARETVQRKYQGSIEELHNAQDKLKEMALKDCLTGLYNRNLFNQFISDILYQGKRSGDTVALIMIDVDHFKAYNDAHGHVAGDVVLKTFADILRKDLRRDTDRIFRYGGEEFAVVLPNTQLDYVETFTENIIAKLNQLAIPHRTSPLGYLTASFGIYVTNGKEGEMVSDMVRKADSALYNAKDAGRNRYSVFRDSKE